MPEEQLPKISPKFEMVRLGEEVPSDFRLERLKHWCNLFDTNNLAPPYDGGSFGNLSFRVREGELPFIITGTNIGLKNRLENEHFVLVERVDFENTKVFYRGARKPSSESMVHAAVYSNFPLVGAVFHGHHNGILAYTHWIEAPITAKEEPYGTLELVRQVQTLLRQLQPNPSNSPGMFNMKNHGFVAYGRTMDETGEHVSSVLAKVNKLTSQQNVPGSNEGHPFG